MKIQQSFKAFKVTQLTSTEESIFVNLLLPVVAVKPLLAFVAAYHLRRKHSQVGEISLNFDDQIK